MLTTVCLSVCVRVSLTKVLWFMADNGSVLDARRQQSVRPSARQLSRLLDQLHDQPSLSLITDRTLMMFDSHVRRSQCFRLVFTGALRHYDHVARILWAAVQPRLANMTHTDRDTVVKFKASVVVVFNEEHIVPSEYVFLMRANTLRTLVQLTGLPDRPVRQPVFAGCTRRLCDRRLWLVTKSALEVYIVHDDVLYKLTTFIFTWICM